MIKSFIPLQIVNFILISVSRVGTKEGGSRFLTYVDSVLGFRHLLQQSDLDKTLSMCTGLRGKLRSRFLVLSDDRVPPPPPQGQGQNQGRGKRSRRDSEEDVSSKRNRNQNRAGSVPGVSKIGTGTRSTPPRAAKASQVAATARLPPPTEDVATGSNEDWASADDTVMDENVV